MSISILGGQAQGLSLSVPRGSLIRPTSVMLRRRLFDYKQDWSDSHFVDCFAGSGSVGFEAWSRGAKTLTSIEYSKVVFSSLHKNRELIAQRFSQEIKERPIHLFLQDALKGISSYLFPRDESSLVFYIDPPYGDLEKYEKIISLLVQKHKKAGEQREVQLWIESDSLKGFPISHWETYSPYKTFEQGSKYTVLISL